MVERARERSGRPRRPDPRRSRRRAATARSARRAARRPRPRSGGTVRSSKLVPISSRGPPSVFRGAPPPKGCLQAETFPEADRPCASASGQRFNRRSVGLLCGERRYRFREACSGSSAVGRPPPLAFGRLIEAVDGRLDEEMVRTLVGMLVALGWRRFRVIVPRLMVPVAMKSSFPAAARDGDLAAIIARAVQFPPLVCRLPCRQSRWLP